MTRRAPRQARSLRPDRPVACHSRPQPAWTAKALKLLKKRSPLTAFPYLSHAGFLGAAKAFPEHRFAVAGVCRDGSVTNRPGARFGLRAIRAASHMLHDATHPCFDVSPTPFLGDAGDLALPNTSLEAMRTAMHVHKAPLIAAHERVWRGGDHSITLLEALNALPFVGMDSVAVASV